MKYEKKRTYPVCQLDESEMVATMFLNNTIQDGGLDRFGQPTLNGYAFAAEMMDLKSMGFKITVDINSVGGGVVPGLSIFDAVVRTKADTRVVGLAASMAAAISQAGVKRFMNDIGAIMFHGITQNETPDQYMAILDAQLRGILETRSKLTRAVIDEIFDGGEDVFFALVGVPDDRHAEKMGLIDEVIATGLSVPQERLETAENRYKLVTAYNQILAPQPEPDKPNSKKMENNFLQVKAKLKLDPEASEAAVLEAINKLEQNAAGTEALKKANETLTAENTGLKESRVNGLVNAAKEGGYPEDQLDSLKSFAEANFEGATNLVKSVLGVGSLQGEQNGAATAQNLGLSVTAQAQAQAKKEKEEKEEEGKLLKYDEYMASAENEAKFFALSTEDQNKVLDAHNLANNIKTT